MPYVFFFVALKQVLIKHMETAPRDILGGFPRMSREETVNMINQTQKSLEAKFGGKETSTDSKSGIPSLFEINVPVPLELMQQNKDGEFSLSLIIFCDSYMLICIQESGCNKHLN